ncbi:uncharacterized protein LOC125491300 [Plutella xylostella]|uniref:uncharacterized protein LOC125491300 n=1 Tax=Plutella xylostella TaxID=51655 RepID=UPI002032233E|nr:uncharacterized protein LOC125491300 [Plutella xylostella]
MEECGISGPTNQWFRNYLTDRTLRTAVGGAVGSEVRVDLGVPTGSVYGPVGYIMHHAARSPPAARATPAAAAATPDAPACVTAAQLSVLLDTIAKAAETNRILLERMSSDPRTCTPPARCGPGAASPPARATASDYQTPPPGTFAKCTARFDGAGRSADQLDAFIDAVQVYKECANVSDEHALSGLPMLLEGDAAVWWRGVRASVAGWGAALQRLRAMYGTPLPAYKVFRAIFSSEQNEVRSDVYISRVRALLAQLPYELLEDTKLDIIYGLLSYHIRKRIPREGASSVDDLIVKCRAVEEASREVRNSSNPSNNTRQNVYPSAATHNCLNPPSAVPFSNNFNPLTDRPTYIPVHNLPTPSSSSGPNGATRVRPRCAHCRRLGHHVDDCRTKERETVESTPGNPPLRCYGCGQLGVVRSRCQTCNKQTRPTTNLHSHVKERAGNNSPGHAVNSQRGEHEFLSAEFQGKYDPRPLVNIKVGGALGAAVLDTGATHSIASNMLYDIMCKKGVKFEDTFHTVYLADGSRQLRRTLVGATQVSIEDRSFDVSFLVFPGSNTRTTLGRDAIITAGIVLNLAHGAWAFGDAPSRQYKFETAVRLRTTTGHIRPAIKVGTHPPKILHHRRTPTWFRRVIPNHASDARPHTNPVRKHDPRVRFYHDLRPVLVQGEAYHERLCRPPHHRRGRRSV